MRTESGAQTLLALLVITTLISGTSSAAVVPGRWDKVDVLAQGSEITVQLKSGDLLPSKFLGSTQDAITIQLDTGSELALQKESIARVIQPGPRSNKAAWLGAAIGGGGGAAIGLAIKSDEGYAAILPPLVGLLAGAATGALIGHYALAKPREDVLLYLAP